MIAKILTWLFTKSLPLGLGYVKNLGKGYGTTFVCVATIIGAICGYLTDQLDVDAASILIAGSVQQLYQRRATAHVEKKVETVQAKVETVTRNVADVQEGVETAAEVAAEVTERAEEAVEKAEAAVEAVQGPTPIKRKPGGSGKF